MPRFESSRPASPAPPGSPASPVREDLAGHVRRALGRTLGVPPGDLTDGRAGLGQLGVGSMAALELQRRLEADLGVPVSLHVVLTAAVVDDLIDHVTARYEQAAA
ncbi:acyl carrier protein [Streptomyces sp. NPDC057249]|uniref:acyl carrier protein n=1 Tax=Streptomyces sp. NPDC057249 TaxID=3346067 RepID=UPI0036341A91